MFLCSPVHILCAIGRSETLQEMEAVVHLSQGLFCASQRVLVRRNPSYRLALQGRHSEQAEVLFLAWGAAKF